MASVYASADVVANLKAAGVSADAISTWQKFYEGVAINTSKNLTAVQRSALLKNILGGINGRYSSKIYAEKQK